MFIAVSKGEGEVSQATLLSDPIYSNQIAPHHIK